MLTRIKKWGNSLALRIPKSFAEQANVREGSAVDLSVIDGRLVARPAEERYELAELLDGVDESNLHAEVESGARRGRESW